MLIQQVLFFRKCVREKNTKKSEERQVGKVYREKVLLVWGKDDLLMT